MSKTEKATREYLQTLSKDQVINLCLQFMFDVEVSELQLDQLKQQLAEKDKEHLLDEQEFQHYCAFKHIEPAIKGCLDREREYEKQLVEKDKEIERLKNLFELNNEVVINQGKEIFGLRVQVLQQKQNQTQLAIQELEKVKDYICDYSEITGQVWNHTLRFLNNRIKELKGEKDDNC